MTLSFEKPNSSGPTTTADSAADGRMKDGAKQLKKRILKKKIRANRSL